MPRRPRIAVAGVPLHLIQRGNNRQACFYRTDDYRQYLEWLREYAQDSGCAVHAYVLMTNHVHLLLTPTRADSASQLMKRLGQRYVQYINRTYRRSGTLWEGRYRSCIAQDEAYVLRCYRYIELNPVRAGMVGHPADYPWSSYGSNGEGIGGYPLTPHSQYSALGKDDAGRRAVYQALFRHRMPDAMIDEIRRATNGNFALGNDRFKEEIEAVLGRRVQPGRPGRPKKRDGEQLE